MKRIIALAAALLLMFCCVVPAFAAESRQRVYDYAGLLSGEDAAALERELEQTVDTVGMDVVVLTSNSKNGATIREYADDFYDNGGFGTGDEHSGLVLFIDMEERTVYLGTTGQAITYYTDERIHDMTDGDDILYSYLSAGDYRTAIERCLGRMIYFHNQGIDPKQYTYEEAVQAVPQKRLTLFEVIIADAIPAIIGFLVVNNIKKEYAMKTEKKKAADFRLAYQSTAAFAFAASGDELVSRNVARRIIPVVTNHDSSGGSAGRSTIHMGGSGTFHGGGGGGRHF